MKKEWLTLKEVQELLNYSSRNPVYRFARLNGIRVSKPTGTHYFNYADIMAVFEAKAVRMGV
ncbi:MAG: DNA-binding protein [Chitinophagaceae bacterium]|nr:MAG: DNA-binding protein [Chitinophagaceae bacterium]